MNRLPILTDHEFHSTLTSALSCAADKYRDNAKILRELTGCDSLVAQFERQAIEADALCCKLIDEAR